MILSIKNLNIGFYDNQVYKPAIRNLSFELAAGEVLGVVGESGCGKSITNYALMGLLPSNALVTADRLELCGKKLLELNKKQWRDFRGNDVAMIFQDPMNALNPTITIEKQLVEMLSKMQKGKSGKEYRQMALKLLDKVGIPAAHLRLKNYPYELSGGMAQRVVIAMALACKPSILIADEPTTALDVTIQAQILNLLDQIRIDSNMAVIIVSHDIGIISEYADRIQVMYSGEVVESGTARQVTTNPYHPYTKGLLESLPGQGDKVPKSDLNTIPGVVIPIERQVEGCRYVERCPNAQDICHTTPPELIQISNNLSDLSRCHLRG
ncbi:ABC transporter ATP-binding protein [Aliikangiella coralliicola]|uniref:ABC-type dipeptide transporter n=1 Tax=Aliikangiella coralliicola TaxID=2592383 RepID=A0A545U666_9GAMM|nr:ABC transporter ATP-binding protein [Aliikangiella coralliicola]TQV84971.1 ABC transporter ATP-binding protein [Aliikangiella coralliicola]